MKPPKLVDTNYFPGRVRFNESNDCTVRAVAAATSLSYDVVHRAAREAGRRARKGFWIEKILNQLKKEGLIQKWAESRMYDAKRFDRMWRKGSYRGATAYPTLAQCMHMLGNGRYCLETRVHAFSVVNGVVYDHGYKPAMRYRVQAIFTITL
jgi:hypothetical protein